MAESPTRSPAPAVRPQKRSRAGTASAAATGRFTTPEQVADLVVFLASDRSGNITGSDLRVDGGLITTI